jgi:hypothetical protein
MYLKDTGCESADLIPRAQGRNKQRELVNTVMNLRGSIKCGEFEWLSNYRLLKQDSVLWN